MRHAISSLRLASVPAHAIRSSLQNANGPLRLINSVPQSTIDLWSCSSLTSLVGTRPVVVSRADSGVFDYANTGEPQFVHETVPFSLAMERIQHSAADGTMYYLRQSPLSTLGLRFAPYVITDLLPVHDGHWPHLWIGAAGCVTPLHYDEMNNLITLLQGRKRVMLLPPSEYAALYPFGFGYRRGHVSRVNPEAVDKQAFPSFPSNQVCEVVLDAGDSLFIPAFWWHYVRSVDISISVNTWWPMHSGQLVAPATVDYLRSAYLTGKLEQVLTTCTDIPIDRAVELAESASVKGLSVAAVLFIGVALQLAIQHLKQQFSVHTHINWVCSYDSSVLANMAVLPRAISAQLDSTLAMVKTVALTGQILDTTTRRQTLEELKRFVSQYVYGARDNGH